MFSQDSRYAKLPDEVTTDAAGRTLTSRSIRLTPVVTGDFKHTLEAVDRLDRLAATYYRQPRRWWRICDANAGFLSPQELLGAEPIVTQRFPLQLTSGEPVWSSLMSELFATVGVIDCVLEETARVVKADRDCGGETVEVDAEELSRALVISYNALNVTQSALVVIMRNHGFTPGHPQTVERTGKQITIPPVV